jgi:hypothetical protein
MRRLFAICIFLLAMHSLLTAQQGFFLDTWQAKNISAPGYNDMPMTAEPANVSVTISSKDTLTRIPVYMYGDNANTFTTSMSENKTLMKRIADRHMGVLRGPSGSISDVYFWNRSHYQVPADVPSVLLSGGDNTGWEWYGKRPDPWENWSMDVDSFYRILKQANVTGLITVNYGYARYGTSDDPVAQAAHMAADWVRYDNGRTKFWEIGNEVFGSWEAGYRIDPALNKDGQPEYITGKLYGQHCNVFIDSMKAAAASIGVEIYIGAVAVEASTTGPSGWNVDLMKEAGDGIDFYIIHSYYTPYNQNSNATVILNAPQLTQGYINYLKTCATTAGKSMKPVALTEYNTFAIGSKQPVSQIGGMFSAMVVGEAIKAGLGEASRWDLANGWDNGNDHGMFSFGDEPGVSQFAPRPAFFYLYYMQKFMGNVLLKSSVKGTTDIGVYASSFSTGHVAAMITNKGVSTQMVRINIDSATIGERIYTYTLVGGTDVPANPLMPFSRKVYVNGEGPSGVAGGPLNYETLKARSSVIDHEIIIEAPPFSVTYLIADTGNLRLIHNDTVYAAIKWNNPADIVYGTQLAAVQLNATANMNGTFAYNPPAGTKLNAGAGIDLKVTFTPASNVTYSPVTKTVKINVSKAVPNVQWTTPEDITSPAPLGDAQLNATSGVDGDFVYDPPAGTVLDPGNGQELKVTFYPSDTVNYEEVIKTVQINVHAVSGVSGNEQNTFGIYPVPVKDKLVLSNLSVFGDVKVLVVKIMNTDGSLVYQSEIAHDGDSKEIGTSSLKPGVYIISVSGGNRSFVRRFSKGN